MPDEQRVTPGRIVIYVGGDDVLEPNGVAIVTATEDDPVDPDLEVPGGMIGVCVLPPMGNGGNDVHHTWARYDEGTLRRERGRLPGTSGVEYGPGTWHWPVRS